MTSIEAMVEPSIVARERQREFIFLVTAIAVMTSIQWLGRFSGVWLLEHNLPGLLLILSTSIDHALLAASQISLGWFLLLGVFRRVATDFIWWLVGVRMADKDFVGHRNALVRALTGSLDRLERRVFRRNSVFYVWSFFTMGMYESHLYGKRGYSLVWVYGIGVPGSIVTTAGMYYAGAWLASFNEVLRLLMYGGAAIVGLMTVWQLRERMVFRYHHHWVFRPTHLNEWEDLVSRVRWWWLSYRHWRNLRFVFEE